MKKQAPQDHLGATTRGWASDPWLDPTPIRYEMMYEPLWDVHEIGPRGHPSHQRITQDADASRASIDG